MTNHPHRSTQRTLDQYAAHYRVPVHHTISQDGPHIHQGTYVFADDVAAYRWGFWHLRDYAVSTVSGPVLWLRRRAQPERPLNLDRSKPMTTTHPHGSTQRIRRV